MATDASLTVLVVHPGGELFGSDRMLWESVQGLRDADCRVVVALPTDGPLVKELRDAGAEVLISPMLVLRKALFTPRGLPVLLRDMVRGLTATWKLITHVRPDVIYVSTIVLPQWPVVARLRGVPAISHIHEAEASGNRIVNRVLYSPQRASTRIIVNSAFTLSAVSRALPSLARRALLVHNGIVTPDAVTPPRSELRGPLRVLYVGRLSPRKGPDLVIAAADTLLRSGRDTQVTLLGSVFDGYEWFEEQLRTQAADCGVPVNFAGFHRDVWPFLAAADILVVPSLVDESFGNTAVEGILAERAVVTSDGPGLREAIENYPNATVVPAGDASKIAEALEHISANWTSVTTQTAKSRDQALRRHSPAQYRSAVAAEVISVATRRAPH